MSSRLSGLPRQPARPPPGLRTFGLTKRFPGKTAVDSVTLDVPAGKMLALLGPSGCGKTTTLRLVAGHETPDGGRVLLGGVDVTRLPPERRDIGMVFQSYALFPHLTVFGNVAFGLRARRTAPDEERERVRDALRTVGLEGTGPRRVESLSGGEQQRVALARALVLAPRLLLFDEPLSNLDAALRVATRQEIRRIQRESGVTALYVTHDQEEALAIADRVAVMKDGRIRREGAPEEVYGEPGDRFTAIFLGNAHVIDGRVENGRVVTADGFSVESAAALTEGANVSVSIRREAVRLAPGRGARVVERSFLGEAWHVVLDASGLRLNVRHPAGDGAPAAPGEETAFSVDPSEVRPLEDNA